MKKSGFTLVELLVVLVVLGIVTAVVVPSFLGYLQSLNVQQAVQQFARDADQARSQARLSNSCRVFSYVNASSYSVTSYASPNCSGTATTTSYPLPTNIVLTLRSTQKTAVFVPPYGINFTGIPLDVTVSSSLRSSSSVALRITGVMGSVVSQ